jgi:transposase
MRVREGLGALSSVSVSSVARPAMEPALAFPRDRGGVSYKEVVMSEKRQKYDREFREGAVRIVRETGKSIAAVARDLGIHEGTLGNWVARDRQAREGRGELTRDDVGELKRLRSENAELRMERDVLKRSVVLWVKEATK